MHIKPILSKIQSTQHKKSTFKDTIYIAYKNVLSKMQSTQHIKMYFQRRIQSFVTCFCFCSADSVCDLYLGQNFSSAVYLGYGILDDPCFLIYCVYFSVALVPSLVHALSVFFPSATFSLSPLFLVATWPHQPLEVLSHLQLFAEITKQNKKKKEHKSTIMYTKVYCKLKPNEILKMSTVQL